MKAKKGGVLILRDRPPAGEENYMAKVLELAARIPPGQLRHASVYHSWWCGVLINGSRCTCNPEVVMRGDPNDN